MRNARTVILVAAVAALMVVAGCQKVSVMDDKGQPIAFAKIQITSYGGEGSSMPVMTDMLGNAFLSTNLAEPDAKESLIVSKEGYATRTVNRTKDSDITVTLQATSGSPKKTSDSSKSKDSQE